jgi:hypothetical protein
MIFAENGSGCVALSDFMRIFALEKTNNCYGNKTK